jgi:integrator complex subunit 12
VDQEDSEATDIEEEGGDEESFSLDMDGMGAFGDLHCVVCKTILNKPGNQLVECQECHSLYHQSCHKPPATDPDVLDPRTIWFCSSCTKNMRKSSVKSSSSTKPSTTASSAFQVAVNIGKESALQLVRERSMKQPETPTTPTAQPFRRAEATKPGTGPGAVTAKPIGLAGLAANLNHKSSASTVSGSSSSSSSTSTAQVAAGAAADRRLQIMRKKAAKANEKKRSGSK